MIKKREFDDAAGGQFEGLEDATIRSGVKSFVSGTFVGALIGGTTAMAFRSLWFAGDEPPIRVKGGSLHVDVLSKSATWEPNESGHKWDAHGSRKKWRLNSWFGRGKDEFDVVLVSSSKVYVPSSRTGKDVTIYYTENKSDGSTEVRWVQLKSKNKKTEVIGASHDLDPTQDARGLNFNVPGYISKIKVDNYPEWTFNSAADLDYALLMDF